MFELLVLIFEAFANKRENQEARGTGKRQHRLEPGTDLEGARPKLDRYGLDHAVPVLVYDVGPDEMIQPAKMRAGDKRRQIETRLEAEAEAREAAEEPNADHMTLPPMVELVPGARQGQADPATGRSLAGARQAEADLSAPTPPPLVTAAGAKYPYQFQKQAKVTHRVATEVPRPVAITVKLDPIQHSAQAGRHQRKRSAVAELLMRPKSLSQVLQAKVVLEPPLSLRPNSW